VKCFNERHETVEKSVLKRKIRREARQMEEVKSSAMLPAAYQ
jgi:hypothetical protein